MLNINFYSRKQECIDCLTNNFFKKKLTNLNIDLINVNFMNQSLWRSVLLLSLSSFWVQDLPTRTLSLPQFSLSSKNSIKSWRREDV
jgi:hypothetical protein